MRKHSKITTRISYTCMYRKEDDAYWEQNCNYQKSINKFQLRKPNYVSPI